MTTRRILHLDLDAFFCAVEELRDPTLIGIPFAVGGRPEHRGVVSSCSYAARSHGIHSAMPMALAVRILPTLRIISSHYSDYSKMSDQVMAILHNLTPLVEQISIDEAFLDITELSDTSVDIARNIQENILEKLRLPCSLGVATNKLVSKIANNVGKAAGQRKHPGLPPNAITVVKPGEERDFLDPLPVDALWGVGPKTAERLNQIGIHTIGDMARLPSSDLSYRFGKHGQQLWLHAQGIDESPIVTFHEAKSISQETTFAEDISDQETLLRTLQSLSEQVGRRLRKAETGGITIKIKLRWGDFKTLTRQITLQNPINSDREIYQVTRDLFLKNWSARKPVRLIGVGVSGLGIRPYQLTFWDRPLQSDLDKNHKLQATLDELRERFGEKSIRRGSEVESKKW